MRLVLLQLISFWFEISASLNLEGGGASFAAALYEEWFKRFPRNGGEDIKVSYDVLGSSKGKMWIKNQLVTHKDRVPVFVGSDTPFSDSDFEKYSTLQFFPIVGG